MCIRCKFKHGWPETVLDWHLKWLVISVRPILRIGEYSLVALQHWWIRYIGLRVSADADAPAVVTINNNRTRRLKHMVRVSGLTECDYKWGRHFYSRCAVQTAGVTRVDIKGTPPPCTLRGASITDTLGKHMPACQRDTPAVEIWHTDLQHWLCLVLSKHTLCNSVEAEIDRFVSVTPVDRSKFATACDWWCHNHHLYPNVARVAKRYLCAPPTSVASKYWGLSVCITGTLCVTSDKTMSRPNWLKGNWELTLLFLILNFIDSCCVWLSTTDQRHPPPRCNWPVPPPLLLVAAAVSGAFDLSVTQRHVRSWSVSVSASVDSKKLVYRYRSKMAYSV